MGFLYFYFQPCLYRNLCLSCFCTSSLCYRQKKASCAKQENYVSQNIALPNSSEMTEVGWILVKWVAKETVEGLVVKNLKHHTKSHIT